MKNSIKTSRSIGLVLVALLIVLTGLFGSTPAHATEVDRTLDVGNGPAGIAVNSDGSRIYVSNHFDDTVSVINGATNRVIDTIDVRPGGMGTTRPWGIVVSPDDAKVYVAGSAFPGIRVIDAADHSLSWVAGDTGSTPEALAITADGDYLWTTSRLDSTIAKVSTATDEVVATYEGLVVGPWDIVAHPQNDSVYVSGSNGDSNRLVEINAATGNISKSRAIVGASSSLAISPRGDQVFAANNSGDIWRYTTAHLSIVGPQLSPEHGAGQIVFNATGSHLFVSQNPAGTVSTVNLSTLETVETVEVGANPGAIAVNPELPNDVVYVANYGDDAVSILSGEIPLSAVEPAPPAQAPVPAPAPAPAPAPLPAPVPEPAVPDASAPSGPQSATLSVQAKSVRKKLKLGRKTKLVRRVSTNAAVSDVRVSCLKGKKTLQGKKARRSCKLKRVASANTAKVTVRPKCTKKLKIRVTVTAAKAGMTTQVWSRTWKAKKQPRVSCPA